MAEKRRINMSLNLNSVLQRQTWEIIRKIPAGRRTDEICRMLCGFQNMERQGWLSDIRQIIREELLESKIAFGSAINEKVNKTSESQSVSDDVLGFLRSLQEGDGIG
jgi:hypothetical protein